jgi:hypothetical protein
VKPPKGFPKRVKLLSRIWDIEYTDTVSPSEDLSGLCSSYSHTICIDAKQGTERMRDTLVHEMIHAVFRYGVHEDLPDELEERFVRIATLAFFEIIRNCADFWSEE